MGRLLDLVQLTGIVADRAVEELDLPRLRRRARTAAVLGAGVLADSADLARIARVRRRKLPAALSGTRVRLEQRLREADADDPGVLELRRELARSWEESGNPAAAREQLRIVLDAVVRTTGPDGAQARRAREEIGFLDARARSRRRHPR